MRVRGRRLPFSSGQVLAVFAVVLCALSLRSAVASLSPVVEYMAGDFMMSAAILGVAGAIPPAAYAIVGLFTPALGRRAGLETAMIVAVVAISAGMISRVLVNDSTAFLATTALLFAGVGMGNVLLPPLVKKYFPEQIGFMTSLYVSMLGLSTFVPPLIAVPLADIGGWRFSLGVWALFAVAALGPWIVLMIRDRRTPASPMDFSDDTGPLTQVRTDTGSLSVTEAIRVSQRRGAKVPVTARLLRLPLPWLLVLVFIVSSATTYTAFIWLPPMLMEIAGFDTAAAGALLSLLVLLGLPLGLVVPTLVVRFQATRTIFFVATVSGIIGWLGLLFFPLPALVPLWVIGVGLTGGVFPLSLVLLNIRARTPESAVALSGFVQGFGYAITAVFPIVIGVLRDSTGGWLVPVLVMMGILVIALPAGWAVGRRTTVEQEWVRRHGSW